MKIFLHNQPLMSYIVYVLLALLLCRVFYFYFQPETVLVGVIPDDAFYYLDLAKHRAAFGVWSLEGLTSATGFHLLYAYILVLIYKIFPHISINNLYIVISLLSVLTITWAAHLTSKVATKFSNLSGGLISLAPFFTWACLVQVSSLMESWLVIYFSAITMYLVFNETKIKACNFFILILVGLLGSLARSDYGMLPGIIFGCLLIGYRFWGDYEALIRSALLLIGASVGVGLVLIHNVLIAGNVLQSSAQTKLFWSELFGHKIYAPLSLFAGAVMPVGGGSFPVIAILVVISGLCIYGVIKIFKIGFGYKKINQQLIATLACLMVITAYLLFYRYNSEALQLWYFANFLVPYSIFLALSCALVFTQRIQSVSMLIISFYFILGLSKLFFVPWPYQMQMMAAGKYVAEDRSKSLYAAWNAGIVNYYSGGKIVNLDGLVNDEILVYIKQNRLFDYLKERNIRYIIDDVEMISETRLRKKGGYDDERINRCVRQIKIVNSGLYEKSVVKIGLFEVQENCN